MKTFSRLCALLIIAGWDAFWAGVLFLLWRPEYRTHLGLGGFSADGDITGTGAARVIATVVSLAAIAIAVPALSAVLSRHGHAAPPVEPVPPAHSQSTSTTSPPRIHAEIPTDRADTRAEPPASLHAGVHAGSASPAPVTGDEPADLTALRERIDRQEEEVRRLRDAVVRGNTTPPERDGQDGAPNGRM